MGEGWRNDFSATELDDFDDRDELRRRYYGLMQELRTVLPGVQVLVAFLLTVPFAAQFGSLDDLGTHLFGVALLTALLSVVAFLTPTALHRMGSRTARSSRLALSIQLTRAGLLMLGISLLASLMVVARFVFDTLAATVLVTLTGSLMLLLWVVLPLWSSRSIRAERMAQRDAEDGRASDVT